MVQVTPATLATVNGPFSQLRTGTIASATTDTVVVVVGGTSFRAQALDTYEPIEGDLVAVLRQDSTWLVLGRISGQGPNEVTDGSFEETTPGLLPDGWTLYNVSGVSTAVVVTRAGAPGGTQTLRVFPAAGGSNVSLVYSPAISVVPGETWNLAAYVGGDYEEFTANTADADLVALWFANDTNLYPTTSAADSTVASLVDVTQLPPFTGLSGSVTVPTGAAVMRVALRSTVTEGQALEWDFVTARQLGEGVGAGPSPTLFNYTSITASTAAVGAVHTVGFTTPTLIFRPGRAYRVRAKGFVQSTISGDSVRIRILKTGTAGQGLIDSFSGIVINGNNGMTSFNLVNNFRINPAGPAVTDVLAMTYIRQTGTGNVFIGATAANPAYIEIYDIGRYEEFPGANTLV